MRKILLALALLCPAMLRAQCDPTTHGTNQGSTNPCTTAIVGPWGTNSTQYVTASSVTDFRAFVVGTSQADISVDWFVDTIAGGNATVGTITSNATDWTTRVQYTAPATLGNHTIKAQNHSGTTSARTITVTVIDGVIITCTYNGTANTSCPSLFLHPSDTMATLGAKINGVTGQTPNWFVAPTGGAAVANGNSSTGTITGSAPNFTYNAPASRPASGAVTVYACSATDSNQTTPSSNLCAAMQVTIGLAVHGAAYCTPSESFIVGYFGACQAFHDAIPPTTSGSFPAQITDWTTNIAGATISSGHTTAAPNGVFQAPTSAASGNITIQNTVTGPLQGAPTLSAQNLAVSVVAAASAPNSGSASCYLDTPFWRYRSYDIPLTNTTLSTDAALNGHTFFQLNCFVNGTDVTGVNVALTNATSGGNTLDVNSTVNDNPNNPGACSSTLPCSQRGVIFKEDYVQIWYVSRNFGSDTGEYPDYLFPKIDQIHLQARQSFPFNINRISPAYQQYTITGSNFPLYNVGGTSASGIATSGGTFSGSKWERFCILIDTQGEQGGAGTFKWAFDNSSPWQLPCTSMGTIQASLVALGSSGSPNTLTDGVTVYFTNTVNGSATPSFAVGQTFIINAAPIRNQSILIDVYVPPGQATGAYDLPVVISGGISQTRHVTLNIDNISEDSKPLTRTYYNSLNLTANEYPYHNSTTTAQKLQTHLTDLIVCATYKFSCEGASGGFTPSYTYFTDGTVNVPTYTNFDLEHDPVMAGSITPHGEKQNNTSPQKNSLMGANQSQKYYSQFDFQKHILTTKGYTGTLYQYLPPDEPGNLANCLIMIQNGTVINAIASDSGLAYPALGTTSYSTHCRTSGAPAIGFMNTVQSLYSELGFYEWQRGPNADSRSQYNNFLAQVSGSALNYYDSNSETGKVGSPGASPQTDNFGTSVIIDSPATGHTIVGFASGMGNVQAGDRLYYQADRSLQSATGNSGKGARPGPYEQVVAEANTNNPVGGNGEGQLINEVCMDATHGATCGAATQTVGLPNSPLDGQPTGVTSVCSNDPTGQGLTRCDFAAPTLRMILQAIETEVMDLEKKCSNGIGSCTNSTIYTNVGPNWETMQIWNPDPSWMATARNSLLSNLGTPAGGIPTFTTLSPNTGTQGVATNVTLTGTNFSPAVPTINVGGAVACTVSNQAYGANPATTLTATFTCPSNATTGAQNVNVSNANGTSGNQTWTVSAASAPTLSSISPTSGFQNSSITITLTGTNLLGGTVGGTFIGNGVSLPGVPACNIASNGLSMTCVVTISSSATIGARTVNVATAGGTTGNQTFTVNPAQCTWTGTLTWTGTFTMSCNN